MWCPCTLRIRGRPGGRSNGIKSFSQEKGIALPPETNTWAQARVTGWGLQPVFIGDTNSW